MRLHAQRTLVAGLQVLHIGAGLPQALRRALLGVVGDVGVVNGPLQASGDVLLVRVYSTATTSVKT